MRSSNPFPPKRPNRRPQAGTPGSARASDSIASPSTPTFPQIAQYPQFPQVGRGIMPVAAFNEAASRIRIQTAASEAERARELLLHHAATTTGSPTTTSVPGSTTSPTQIAESAYTSMNVTSEMDSNTAGQVQNNSATSPTLQSIFAPYMTQSDTNMTSAEDSAESDIVAADGSTPASSVSAITTPHNINTFTTSSSDDPRALVAIERAVNSNLQSQISTLQSQKLALQSQVSNMEQQAQEAQDKYDMETRYATGKAADFEQSSQYKTEELQTKVKKLELQIEENGETIDKLLLEGQQAENNITRHVNEVSRLTQELSESQTTVQSRTSIYEESVAALKEEGLSRIASLEQRNSILQQGFAQQTDAEKDGLRARIFELESQLANYTNDFAHLRNQAETRVQEDEEKIIFLERKCNNVHTRLDTTASELTKAQKEHSHLQSEHDALISQYVEVQSSRDQHAEQIAVQKRLNDEALARTAAVEADREALRAQVADLEQNLITARSGGLTSMKAYEDAVLFIHNLESKISEYEQQEQVWVAQNKDLAGNQEQLEEAVKAASELTENAERIEDIKEYYKEKMGALERASASKDTRISKLEARLAANDEETRPSSSHTYVSRTLSPVHGLGFASLDAELQGFSPLMSPNRQHFEHSQDDMLEQGSQTKLQEFDFSEISTVVDQESIETPPAATTLPNRQNLSFSDTMVIGAEVPLELTVGTALPIRQRLGFSGFSTLLDEEPVEPQVVIRTIARPYQQLALSGTSTFLDEEPIEQQNMPVPRPLQQLGFRRPRTVLDLSPIDAGRLAGPSSPEGFGITPVTVQPVAPSPPQVIRQRLSFATPRTMLSETPVETVLPQPQVLPGKITIINRARSPVGRFADKYCPSFVLPALSILLYMIMAWNWFTTSAEHATWLASNELARSSVVQQRADGAGIIFAYGPAHWLVGLVRAIVVFCWTLPTPMNRGAIQGKMFGLAAQVGYDSSLVY